ncbi:peptide-N-glycosidase F-related protein [Pedobacter sp. MW01-1-1]|uniref:peptide-N-glycosidase F-related protein n=1 Tax=Pedobacter sp. MW01-1-1 TaxID=3383027 RepID=UPI003FF0842F
MRKISILMLFTLPFLVNAQQIKTVASQLNIELNFPKADETGRKIYLSYMQFGQPKLAVLTLQKNKVSFSEKVDVNMKASLQTTKPNTTPEPALDPNTITFYFQEGLTTIKTPGNLGRATIEGSAIQAEYEVFKKKYTQIDRRILRFGWAKRGLKPSDSLKVKAINHGIDSIQNEKMDELCAFLETNTSKPYATEAILMYLTAKGSSLNLEKAKGYFNRVPEEQKKSLDGVEISRILSGGLKNTTLLPLESVKEKREPNSVSVLKAVAFYDGYAKPVDFPVQPGLIRVANTKYTKKLSDSERQRLGDSLVIRLTLNASCDNYDRIGRVTIISSPKGVEYNHPEAKQFEALRIMTPFNYLTRQPDQVPYSADISQLAPLFSDKSKDIWVFAEIFGTTGVGQKETIGCDGSLLTYTCNVDIISNQKKAIKGQQAISLLSYYSLNGQDTTAGKNAKEIEFVLEKDVQSARFYLITSGHGAAQGGEEYNWREHVLYLDNKEYVRLNVNQDCTPYEIYNTRINGIYGSGNIATQRRSWCPGGAVPTRLVNLGPLKAGKHRVKIAVPEANLLSTKSTYYLSAYILTDN